LLLLTLNDCPNSKSIERNDLGDLGTDGRITLKLIKINLTFEDVNYIEATEDETYGELL
jgi:hypothetical protein